MISIARPVTHLPRPEERALYAAWSAVRAARQVPWCSSEPERFGHEVLAELLTARDNLLAHITESEGLESPLHAIARSSFRNAQAVQREFEDHRQLIGMLQHLIARLEATCPHQIEDVISIIEEATLFEMRVTMHLNRLNDLLNERTSRVRPRELQGAAAGGS